MASKKYKITQLQDDDSLLELHPATDADIVSVNKGSSAYKGNADNVQGALEEVYDLAVAGSGTVKKVNNVGPDSSGNVTLTPANIGAEAAFTDGSAVIASKDSTTSIITIKGGVKQSGGAILNKTTTEAADIALAKVAATGSYNDLSNKPTIPTVNNGTLTLKIAGTSKATFTANQSGSSEFDVTKASLGLDNVTNNKQVKAISSSTNGNIVAFGGTDGATIADSGKAFTTSVGSTSTDNQIPTAKAVFNAIDALPEPMVFKGSVGTNGTVTWTDLPTAAASNEGNTYKVITAHSADTKCPACKVGDTIISNGTAWVVIPSGDEPSGTVTSVGLAAPTGFSVSGSPVTGSGTLTLGFASGYSLPTTAKQATWDAKQDALAAQTAYTSKGSATKVPQITTNALGQVTSITEVTITDNNDNQTIKGNGTAFGANAAVNIVAGSNVTVTPDTTNNKITIASSYTDTNQKVKAGDVTFGGNDVVGFVGQNNVTVTGNATNKTITIDGAHTHSIALAADSGTSAVSLSANTKYKLTAGGSSIIFTTPTDTNTHNSHGVTVVSGKKADGTTDISASSAQSQSGLHSVTLGDSGVTAGVYSAVQVNAKGIVVKGAVSFEVGSKSGTNTPSDNLVVGGIFYQEI